MKSTRAAKKSCDYLLDLSRLNQIENFLDLEAIQKVLDVTVTCHVQIRLFWKNVYEGFLFTQSFDAAKYNCKWSGYQ